MSYFVYTVADGFINCKLSTEAEAQQLADENGDTHAILQAPEDHEGVDYAYVVDGVSVPQTSTQANEQALEEFREERNKRLAATDWTQTLDSPLSETDKQNYLTLRQILRDMPQADGFDPLNPVWPTLP
jgi:nitric oxide synthase oxygenase domain/subunit